MNNQQNLWYRLTASRATDENEARQEYMTKVIYIILNVIGLILCIAFFIGWMVGPIPNEAVVVTIVIELFLIGGWWAANWGYWRVASYAPPLMFFLLALQLNRTNGIGSVAMVQYAIVVLLVAMLQGGAIQWIAMALSIGAYLVMGWLHVQGFFPQVPAPEENFVSFAIPVAGILIFITLLQWFYTSQFRRTMVELVEHKATLQQRVEERTAELEESMAEQEQLQQQIIEAQRQALKELSVPVIPIMNRVIVMPLIGSIDSMRARDVTRSLLAGISKHQARVVILDVTGVPIIDSGVANHLNKTIQAARLKGAYTIITGISDAVAETIVDLGINWGEITTLSDLQTGLVTALRRMGIRLAKDEQ
jgi:anti-anti-sigma regulatory factor